MSARAARVTNETSCGAVRGISRRPTNMIAIATPTATMSTTRPVIASAGMGGSCSTSSPTTGARKSWIQPPTSISPPSTDSAASTIRGMVITAGDSCGCTSFSQRFSPKKVISISRVM